jgi:hypothetical protein
MPPLLPNPNFLVVEGAVEKRLIPELIELRGVQWEVAKGRYAVQIQDYDGISNILAPGEIETALKTSGLKALGIVFDADGLHSDKDYRWNSMVARCKDFGIELPATAPAGGVILNLLTGVRFGVWMMPDNVRRGMLETFLLELVPDQTNPVFAHAIAAMKKAKEIGAPFRDTHEDKASIHTWLSWQDAPGAQLHEAVKFKTLNSQSPKADAFVQWFRTLFEV